MDSHDDQHGVGDPTVDLVHDLPDLRRRLHSRASIEVLTDEVSSEGLSWRLPRRASSLEISGARWICLLLRFGLGFPVLDRARRKKGDFRSGMGRGIYRFGAVRTRVELDLNFGGIPAVRALSCPWGTRFGARFREGESVRLGLR
jgi:hypothetical protein